jgi:hypothetical protein
MNMKKTGIVEQLLSKASGEPTKGSEIDVNVEAARAASSRLRKALAAADDGGIAAAVSDLLALSR